MTREIKHRSRSHVMRGDNVLPHLDVAQIPELQPVLRRLGENTCDYSAPSFNRVAHVKLIAGALVALRASR